MKRTLGVVGTVLLHALIVLAMLDLTAHERKLPKKGDPVAVHIPPSIDRLTGEENVGAGLACGGYHYNGVGILVSPGTGVVIDVGDNTPAQRAGLLVGDILLDRDQLQPDAYQPGTNLTLRVQRDGRELAIHIHIGRICSE